MPAHVHDVPHVCSDDVTEPPARHTGELPALGLADELPPVALQTILDFAPEVLAELVSAARAVAREVVGLDPPTAGQMRASLPTLWLAMADMLRLVAVIEALPPDRPCPVCASAGRPGYPMSWIADEQLYFCPTDSHTEAPTK